MQPRCDLDAAAEEARIVMVSLAKDALARAGLKATDVDVLLTASTVFSPVPSLASMVVNALGMREDCQAYNLGGMGCR
jgi:3-ketoacyl-CoA synthase